MLRRDRAQIAFRHTKVDEDRTDLIENDKRTLAICLHQIPGMQKQVAGPARDWSMDLAVRQIQLGLLDGGAVGLDRRANRFDSGLVGLDRVSRNLSRRSNLFFLLASRNAFFR